MLPIDKVDYRAFFLLQTVAYQVLFIGSEVYDVYTHYGYPSMYGDDGDNGCPPDFFLGKGGHDHA